MAISMTEAAARHIRRSHDGRGKGEGIRLGVRTTGCSGLAYVLEFVDEVGEEDEVFETHGEKVIIDPKSLTYLDGTELDFVKARIDAVAKEVMAESGVKIDYMVGTMIELPRAALRAAEIAETAKFFSFISALSILGEPIQ